MHQEDSRVKQQPRTPSLLRYLEPENQCAHLSMTLFSSDPGPLENVPFPFVLLLDRDPFSSILDAQFVTDSGSPLKEVMVLIQKDNYRLPRDYPPRISNSTVEEEWRKAFARLTGGGDLHPLITLSEQIGDDGTLLPFAPLFFCKTKRRFFHPPCPSCGTPLSLCRDDAVLEAAGLPRYSSSIHRYLVCSSCLADGHGGTFYTREMANYDPPSVRDRSRLIWDFSRLLSNPAGSSEFPCTVCQESSSCYDAEFKALSRIAPLSFYPFYLLVFESAPLKASDFLALVSGASWDDMERKLRGKGAVGRLRHMTNFREESEGRSSFLFREDDRFFLEVLYLKLTFLAQLADGTFRAPEGPNQASGPVVSVEQTWIKLTGKHSHLPYFWNFELSSIDVTGSLSESPIFRHLPSGTSLYSFGMTWFQSLLVNSLQGPTEVVQAVRDSVERGAAFSEESRAESSGNGESPVFHPRNLLWVPKEGGIPEAWQRLWEEALDLGWALVRWGLQRSPETGGQVFLDKLRSLRRNIAGELFTAKPTVPLPEKGLDERAIFEVLTGIRKRWKAEQAPLPGTGGPEAFPADIAPAGGEDTVPAPRPISADDTLPLDFDPSKLTQEMAGTEEISETVVLSSKLLVDTARIAPLKNALEQEQGSAGPAGMEETVLIGTPRAPEEDELPETIILSPRPEADMPGAKAAPEGPFPSPEEVNRTSPDGEGDPLDQKAKPPASEDDILLETIILRPRQDKTPEDKDR